jgi:hypothetical protein
MVSAEACAHSASPSHGTNSQPPLREFFCRRFHHDMVMQVSSLSPSRALRTVCIAPTRMRCGACRSGKAVWFNENIGALHALLERPKIDVNCWNKDVLTPLHFATLKNHEFVVKLLTDRSNLDMNAMANFDLTLLHQCKTDETQLQKSFADLSYAETQKTQLHNPIGSNKPHQYKWKCQETI